MDNIVKAGADIDMMADIYDSWVAFLEDYANDPLDTEDDCAD